MRAVIPVANDDAVQALRGFFKQLLEKGVVDAVLVPMETPAGSVTPALVSEPGLLDAAAPLAPVMGLNGARVVGPITVREPRGRIAAVLRSCEMRALIELVKLQQASLDDLVTIVVDCPGTFNVPDYQALRANGDVKWQDLLAAAQKSETPSVGDYSLRDACQMCEKPHAVGADILIELFGSDLGAGIAVTLPDDIGTELEMSPVEGSGQRDEIIAKLVQARSTVRDEWLAEIRQRLDGEGVADVMAACVRCHNCMTVCPLCYCKTCLFKSPIFDHEPTQYMNWARRKGAYRLPADTMLFQLTRLNHMVLSCVGCGLCTDACPADLPVARVFRAIGQETQAVFEYEPGRDVEEPLPLITFKEDEWTEVGEER